MKNTIQFSKFFIPAAILSCAIVAFGITGYVTKGFTLGVDFKSGLIQEIQIAPTAFTVSWTGTTSAALSSDRSGSYIVVSGAGIDSQTYSFPYSEFQTVGSLTNAMKEQLEELEIAVNARENTSSQWLLTQGIQRILKTLITVLMQISHHFLQITAFQA